MSCLQGEACWESEAGRECPRSASNPAPDELVLDFDAIGLRDVHRVGGKNASLGELFRTLRPRGVRAVDGFATTASAYREFLRPCVKNRLAAALASIEADDVASLAKAGKEAREAIMAAELAPELAHAIGAAYDRLCERLRIEPSLAVRSSATSEDLPSASFAGQHSTFLNVQGKQDLLRAVHRCFASLFTDRAIDYRIRNGFDHFQVALSVGVQPMVRSDLGSSGVIFTLDPESGFRDVVVVSGAYGLGESIVQGTVAPDEWTVFKPTLRSGFESILARRLGAKESMLVFDQASFGTMAAEVAQADRARFCLEDRDVHTLARWACLIEEHYSKSGDRPQPMDIEWAKDGLTGQLFILQARPETVHSNRKVNVANSYRLTAHPPAPRVTGEAVGQRIAHGVVRLIRSPEEIDQVQPGDVLVTSSTDPAWEPIMKRASAIVTDQGGRTAHAAILSREIGIPCIVGAGNATSILATGEVVTVCCAEGAKGCVYPGKIPFAVDELDLSKVPKTRTRLMVNVGDPSKAFRVAMLPNDGVGLARIEFIISDTIGIHPMALCRYPRLQDSEAVAQIKERLAGGDPQEFFVRKLSEGVAQIAAAFFPKPVIVRTSDFKTNEYARLVGGAEFEPVEENPMLGFRGASRYYDPRYADGFALECRAIKRVRDEMGLTNVKVMIPFCRTTDEARQVVEAMAENGLPQGENGLEIYGMCEVPSNALDGDGFLEIFDGFSIGSNDLTQLTLGLDRDSATVAHLFDESDFAVKSLIVLAIQAARRQQRPIGICGQAPSDDPNFARWLVSQGIDSISLNADSVIGMVEVVSGTEAALEKANLAAPTSLA
ncbi:MAG: phosphoenolpyruvate synthase [Fimbriimonas sp.]